MKRSIFVILAIFAIILVATGISFAQSTDRDNPTPMNSSELSGSFGDHQEDGNKEIFYSFTAGPGELTVTFDVKRRSQGDMASMAFELLPRNGSSTALLCCEGAQSGEGGTGREIATVKLTKRQTVILHITNASIGGGSFHMRLSGATSFGGSSTNSSGSNDSNDNEPVRGSREGDHVSVPASGILHIKMKNGTSQDIDLSRVRNISVRQ